MADITALDIQEMVAHWLSVRPCGYLGSRYGSDIKALLQTPMRAGLGDEFIAKMRADLPVLELLPPGSVNVYLQEQGIDGMVLLIDVAGKTFTVKG